MIARPWAIGIEELYCPSNVRLLPGLLGLTDLGYIEDATVDLLLLLQALTTIAQVDDEKSHYADYDEPDQRCGGKAPQESQPLAPQLVASLPRLSTHCPCGSGAPATTGRHMPG